MAEEITVLFLKGKMKPNGTVVTDWLLWIVEHRYNNNTKFIYTVQKNMSDQNQLELKLYILFGIQQHINGND